MDDPISLSPAHAAFVDEQVAQGDYGSASDYVAALIEAKAREEAQERLEALLLEGLASPSRPWTSVDTERLKHIAANGK